MADIAIYGAGGFGREAALLVTQLSQLDERWNLIGFFDDGVKAGTLVDTLPVLGGMSELNSYPDPIGVVMAVAEPTMRRSLVDRVTNKRVSYPKVIHPSVMLGSQSNVLGRGVILTAGVILTTAIRIEEFTIVNLASTIGHDAVIGSYSSIMPQCSVSGNVKIGGGCFIGAGSRILQGIELAANCVVGAGAVVTKNFPKDSRLIGVPAHPVPKNV